MSRGGSGVAIVMIRVCQEGKDSVKRRRLCQEEEAPSGGGSGAATRIARGLPHRNRYEGPPASRPSQGGSVGGRKALSGGGGFIGRRRLRRKEEAPSGVGSSIATGSARRPRRGSNKCGAGVVCDKK